MKTTEAIGLEISAMIRANDAGSPPDGQVCYDAFVRMLGSDARTAHDALALVTMARRLLNAAAVPEDEIERQLLVAVSALVIKATDALEAATGARAATFEGEVLH